MDANQIQNLFASNVRQLLVDADLDYDKLYEIRLRVGRPLFLTYDGGECFLRKPGQEQYLVTTEDLKETLEYVTGYSLYAYEDEIGIYQCSGWSQSRCDRKGSAGSGQDHGNEIYFLHQCPSGT